MKLYAVRDVKADCFGSLLGMPTEGIAIRSFSEAICSGKSDFSKYPEDYSLYEMGEYDPNSGVIVAIAPAPKLVITAVAIVNQIKAARLAVEPELPILKQEDK